MFRRSAACEVKYWRILGIEIMEETILVEKKHYKQKHLDFTIEGILDKYNRADIDFTTQHNKTT